MIKRENRERHFFWKIGEERDIARVQKTRRQERFRGRGEVWEETKLVEGGRSEESNAIERERGEDRDDERERL